MSECGTFDFSLVAMEMLGFLSPDSGSVSFSAGFMKYSWVRNQNNLSTINQYTKHKHFNH